MMSERITEAEAIARVTGLTRTRLVAFIEAEAIVPRSEGNALLLENVDIVRLDLLCELSDIYEMDAETAAMVLSLIDQLHTSRAEFAALVKAIAREPADVRARLGAALQAAGKG